MADLTPEAIDRLLERLAKAGKGALVRGVDDITKLLESYQPRKPAYKGPHLTDAQYTELLDRQGGSCAICKDKPRDRLVVDHDHESGAVRGLLCGRCNLALGLLRDDTTRIRAAATYLERSHAD